MDLFVLFNSSFTSVYRNFLMTSNIELINIAREDVLMESVFECYDDDELIQILASYSNFRLHLNSLPISNKSVILAAAHFVSLHVGLQRNMSATAGRQVQKGSPISPIAKDSVIGAYGLTHWYLTTYGIEYKQLESSGNSFSSFATGI